MTLPPLDELVDGLRAGHRTLLGRAITLVESRRPEDEAAARELLARLRPVAPDAERVGITGVPGVGKSTFVDALGVRLVESGHRVAVLAVDPSSSVTGGSILGDKSRMPNLAARDEAFIRPSPSGATLGGVARRTRETMTVVEAAGYDVVLVETVGVGQSETVVSDMVDFFLVLAMPGAGDELQGIKKGVLELADLVAVNKADGDLLPKAREAQADYSAALRYLAPRTPGWRPEAIRVSALTGEGLDDLWNRVIRHRDHTTESGERIRRRTAQRLAWMWTRIDERLREDFRADARVREALPALQDAVSRGEKSPEEAAEELLRRRSG
ncbi:MAG: methylmalonyl Co-A mutase-associated GTPase MeaB [Gemmatimonadetes bacterium]|nr:methylmalonyl Co-A mutase-associated GTPase MeaB [Gemmatimonadota bacterium]